MVLAFVFATTIRNAVQVKQYFNRCWPLSGIGPQFTQTAEDNIWIVLFYGTESAAWDFSILNDPDQTEPYIFSPFLIAAAGPPNNETLRVNVNADSTVIAMLVDSSVDGIDIANLTYEEPVTNTAPTVTMAAPTSPVDGSATQTLTGTFSDDQGNEHRHYHHSVQSGHAGNRHEGRCGGHVGSRLHRAGQHHRRTDRHRNGHGNRRRGID